MNKNNIILLIFIIVVVLILSYFAYKYYAENLVQMYATENLEQKIITVVDPLNTTYSFDGRLIRLVNGKAQINIASGLAEKIEVSVFGVPIFEDLNNDGVKDASLILVYAQGGSGIFYFIASALKDVENNLTIGTNAIYLGDRIMPQSVLVDSGKITANYLDRKKDEPFSTQPSINVSRYFLLSEKTLVEDLGK
ncbi:MAG: hypothetical protein A2312_01080 [Candidatus Staskawiczbacteria bacterium RIFOXYB2_FULL_32_9]|nr:MAG: hypothetical protein UR22_C0018G0007 [Parcubacteria group bacterium GW2011_GWC2_32_10]OGZ78093.1 MAG: hypothetical protein A2360_00815 [Candidatus Staskawiczbacteria bacterium RIFOXYB1_FULL_32_11]OGZ81121.1 MAG: hypothetical protein A2256_02485 [Candidatus Staskawiczbacteria bacterium RIFOXYA2_FULL_32_7]OGZ82776.1 MAG: hypothetical protein A2312_01080 [Candidatus Staskawiczbacteria bacterium RIFOXYB2_FULL_32_9]OGZ88216.1 MAG: hypothetical protein A2463_04470 [Candidatus Staskawiczbacter